MAPKGAVLNARILWSFSSAYQATHNEEYLVLATRSYHYITDHFIDKQYGSIYWSVTHRGEPLDRRKQIYAQAFAVYGLCAYYSITATEASKAAAISIFRDLEKYSWDHQHGGYIEAFSEDWQELADTRLSEKDANEKKTLNTHLHILEAYTSLYKIWPDEALRNRLSDIIVLFATKFLDPNSSHLRLFFDERWNSKSTVISFGHDIEASWLLLKAVEAIGNEQTMPDVKAICIAIARASAEGLDDDGSMFYEYDTSTKIFNREKHWWVQAEAMVGFLYAFQLTGEQLFKEKYLNSWKFIDRYIIDHENGEWFWGVDAQNRTMQGQDKVGFWKCPYHNSRACVELAGIVI